MRATQVDAEPLDEADELLAAPADKAGWLLQGEDDGFRVFPSRLVETLGAAPDSPGHDQRTGLGARRGEAALHQKFVKAPAGEGHRNLSRTPPTAAGPPRRQPFGEWVAKARRWRGSRAVRRNETRRPSTECRMTDARRAIQSSIAAGPGWDEWSGHFFSVHSAVKR